MAAQRLSGLQRRMLRDVYDAEARSGWSVSPSHIELVRALGGNKGNVSMGYLVKAGQCHNEHSASVTSIVFSVYDTF